MKKKIAAQDKEFIGQEDSFIITIPVDKRGKGRFSEAIVEKAGSRKLKRKGGNNDI